MGWLKLHKRWKKQTQSVSSELTEQMTWTVLAALGFPSLNTRPGGLRGRNCVTGSACVRSVLRDLLREQASLSQRQILALKTQLQDFFSLRKWKQTLRTQHSCSCCRVGGSSVALGTAVGTTALLPNRTAGLCFSLSNRHGCNLEQSSAFTSYFMYLCMYEFSAIQQLAPGRCRGKRRAGPGRSVAAPPAWLQPLSPPTLLLGSSGARCKPSWFAEPLQKRPRPLFFRRRAALSPAAPGSAFPPQGGSGPAARCRSPGAWPALRRGGRSDGAR